ncbi:MAG: FlgD immunoglobulin-like domain containing protein [Candidatus Krumholzibacteriia bacterium]
MRRHRCCALFVLLAGLLAPQVAAGWGWHVHQLINRAATRHLPDEFRAFAQWADSLERLSVAADVRAGSDPDEAIRHYIDIDDYDEFLAGTLPHTYAGMVSRFGRERVDSNGILPWAIDETRSELVRHMRDGDWSRAVAAAADLGHYVADCHQPLHLTRNYDGEFAEQRGIHSRYESALTEIYLHELEPAPGHVSAYALPLEAIFETIESVYPGVYLVLNADFRAREAAGGRDSSSTYYDVLWQITGASTRLWVRDASLQVAALWYTAWLDAGAPTLPGSSASWLPPAALGLLPNIPNPFNPRTTIRFKTPEPGTATLRVLDVRGRLVRRLFVGDPGRGERSMTWDGLDQDGREAASGVYRIRLEQRGQAVERRAVLVR